MLYKSKGKLWKLEQQSFGRACTERGKTFSKDVPKIYNSQHIYFPQNFSDSELKKTIFFKMFRYLAYARKRSIEGMYGTLDTPLKSFSLASEYWRHWPNFWVLKTVFRNIVRTLLIFRREKVAVFLLKETAIVSHFQHCRSNVGYLRKGSFFLMNS